MTRRLVAGLCCAVLCLWGVAIGAETRVAFVIGNSDYAHVDKLKNPGNDSLDISVALDGLGFEVHRLANLDRAGTDAAVDLIERRAAGADVALLFYAGHAIQVDGRNYLLPTDARIGSAGDVADQTVPIDAFLRAMQASNGLKLVFLDACRNNPLGPAAASDPRLGQGLARVGSEADFLFAYATQPDNYAWDGTGRNSFFTDALLQHIYTPGQSVSELMIHVRRDVIAATGGRQIPWDNSSLTRQFVFDTSPPTLSEEALFYQVAAGAQDPELMRLYLDRYPNGAHSREAMAAIQTGGATRSLSVTGVDAQAAERLWSLARRGRSRALIEYYLGRYPDGAHAPEARRLRDLLPALENMSSGELCERLATHPGDATAGRAGVPMSRLQTNPFPAIQACSAAVTQAPELPHYVALLARATFASGDQDRAVQLYQKAADLGDIRAMSSLAQLLERGIGFEQNVDAALRWYEAAAAGGSHDAMINLAVILEEGRIVDRDVTRAFDLLRAAAERGSAKARYNLGAVMVRDEIGEGREALENFLKAAQDGEYNGHRAAAILLDKGARVDRDPARAAILLLRGAAEDDGTIVQDLKRGFFDWENDTLAQMQVRLAAAGLYGAPADGDRRPEFIAALEQWRDGGFTEDVLTR